MSTKNIEIIKAIVKDKALIKEGNGQVNITIHDTQSKILLPIKAKNFSRTAKGQFVFQDEEDITYLIENARVEQVFITEQDGVQVINSLDQLSLTAASTELSLATTAEATNDVTAVPNTMVGAKVLGGGL